MSTDVDSLGWIFTDPAAYANPTMWHDVAARVRQEAPILRVCEPGFPDFWAITRHADVMEVERNADIFTNSPLPTLVPASRVAEASSPPVKTLVQMDGEMHKLHRGIVNDWFKPGSVKRLSDRIDELARFYVDRMTEMGGRCDFLRDVALHFPLQVILTLLGLPESDYPRMLTLTQELFGAEDPEVARAMEDESAVSVLLDFVNYFTALTADRRSRPGDDLASVIANATIDGAPLAALDTLGHYVIIATAGHDTTSSAIAGGLLALMEHPDQWDLLRRDPSLIDHGADEVVRYVTPVKHFMRNCQAPFTLRGVTFEPGDLLYLSYASANRDEEVFPNPDRFDLTRPNTSGHVAFGFGRHFCLGAHLARMEVRAIFKELARRVEHIELAGDPAWIRANFVQGPKSVPVAYRMH